MLQRGRRQRQLFGRKERHALLRRQASQHIRGRRGAHGDQCLSEPPPLLGCAEEGLLRGLQCDDLRVHEDLAQLALHESYSSRVSGNVCLDRATTDRGRPRDDGRGVGRRFTRRPLDELPGAGALTAGGWLSGGPSIVRWCGPSQPDHRRSHTAESGLVQGGTAAIGVKCLEMSANTVCALPSAGAVVIGGKAPGWRAGPSVMLSDAAPAIDQQP